MRMDIEFVTRDGVRLRGWHYRPTGGGPAPTVVMAHGFAAVKEMGLDDFAERFAARGLAVVVFDHRGFGASDGDPRQEIDPWLQIRDYSDAVTFAETLAETDPQRIGLWGTSFAGGHVLVVAAQDHRVRCVVSQVPLISGRESARRLVPAPVLLQVLDAHRADRHARMAGDEPAMLPVVSADPTAPSALPTPDSWAWFSARGEGTAFRNEVTLRTMEYAFGYEPGLLIGRISPCPMLMIVALADLVCPADLALEAYARAHEPKRLITIPGGHFDPYSGSGLEEAATAAADWFLLQL
jgi:fermentation-respiration switch protein FrsA (DUF1100 family)